MRHRPFLGSGFICLFAGVLLMSTRPSLGLIEFALGNDPVQNMGWPGGTEQVANIKSRLGHWMGPPFGGGESHFLYREDAAAFNKALETFSRIDAPRLELVVQDGPNHTFILDNRPYDKRATTTMPAEARVDWELIVWNPRSWHMLFSNPRSLFFARDVERFRKPVPAPQIVLYIGGGQIQWEQVKVPKGIVVIDQRDQTHGAGAKVHVQVYDMATGQRITQSTATLKQYRNQKWSEPVQATKGTDGFPEFAGVTGKDQTQIIVSAKGFAPRVINYHATGAPSEQLRVELAPAFEVSGRVTSTEGTPLADAQVRTESVIAMDGTSYQMPEGTEVKTSADGGFVFRNVPEGVITLYCSKEGWQEKSATLQGIVFPNIYQVPPPGGEPGTQLIELQMIGTTTISGIIVEPNGEPYKGEAEVALEPADNSTSWGGTIRAQNGRFEFKGVPAAKYYISTDPTLHFQKDRMGVQTVEVRAGKPQEVKLIRKSEKAANKPAADKPAKP